MCRPPVGWANHMVPEILPSQLFVFKPITNIPSITLSPHFHHDKYNFPQKKSQRYQQYLYQIRLHGIAVELFLLLLLWENILFPSKHATILGKQYIFKLGKSHVKFPLVGIKTAFICVIICLICIPVDCKSYEICNIYN